MSSVTKAVTLTDESLGRPEAVAGTKTLPGIVAFDVFDVMTTASAVLRPLAL